MNGTLRLAETDLAYGDVGANSNPKRKFVDWTIDQQIPVSNPQSLPYTVDPGATLTLFSGVRSTAISGTTEFLLTLSQLAPTRYRFAWDSVGTNPALRTDRGLTLSGATLTLTANGNQTLTLASSVGGSLSAVQVGDTVFIPGVSTGDPAGPFNVLNEGFWVVVSNGGASITLSRGTAPFSGITETVTPSTNGAVDAFSAAGVQVGDQANVSMGFNPPVLGTYVVVAVTSTWFEVFSSVPLPVSATAVPTAAGLQFYFNAKRYVRVLGDQMLVVRVNGDTGNTNQVAPWVPGDPDNMGWYAKVGPVWSAVVVNLAAVPLNILFISAE